MSTDSMVTEVFETVEADPDAILEAYDAESPEELVESGGQHEATTDPVVDADDETATTLFASLQSIVPSSTDTNGRAERTSENESTGESPARGGNADDKNRSTSAVEQIGSVFVSEPTVVTSSRTDSSIGDTDAAATDSNSPQTLTLVGPDPATTRVSNDAFGSADFANDQSEFKWTNPESAETRR